MINTLLLHDYNIIITWLLHHCYIHYHYINIISLLPIITLAIITFCYYFTIRYYYIIITSLLHDYYMIITSFLQMEIWKIM